MAADIPAQAAENIVFYSSIPLIYRKFAYFLDDIIDGNSGKTGVFLGEFIVDKPVAINNIVEEIRKFAIKRGIEL